MLDRIFRDLGRHFREENDLSYLTWAVAKNCVEFLNIFMELFDFDSGEFLKIYREYRSRSGMRADIAVKNGNRLFIIENKIDDTNYHFRSYSRDFGGQNARFGIIVKRDMSIGQKREAERYNFNVKKWKEFVKLLENRLNGEEFSSNVHSVIKAYIEYVKEVCSIMPIGEIRFERLVSLYYFNNLIKDIIENYQNENFECKLNNNTRSAQYRYNECGSGQYFILKRKRGSNKLSPWFGIWYEKEQPEICITIDQEFYPDICSRFRNRGGNRNLYGIELDESGVHFILNQDRFNEFNTSSKEQQREILVRFFNEVIENEIAQYL